MRYESHFLFSCKQNHVQKEGFSLSLFSEKVVVTETCYQMLEVLLFGDRERA